MKIGEAIDRVRILYNESEETNSEFLPTKLIYNKLLSVRELIVLQSKPSSFHESDLQPIHSIGMIPQYESSGLKIMKSSNALPSILSMNLKRKVLVTSETGMVTFSSISYQDVSKLAASRYTTNIPYYYIRDNYLYLVNSRIGSTVVYTIWRDPILAYRMNLTNQGLSTAMNNGEINFFTPLGLADKIITLAAKELIISVQQEQKNANIQ